nr:hypothetical protein GCM10020092_012260 [Actinoplanes digitatis]
MNDETKTMSIAFGCRPSSVGMTSMLSHRTDRRRQRPPEREHPADVDAEQPRHVRRERRGAHPQADVRPGEQDRQQTDDGEDGREHEQVEARQQRDPADVERVPAERRAAGRNSLP